MVDIAERIETFLGEFRIIVPALGALLGFQLITAFQATYDALPAYVRAANFAAVTSTAASLVFLLIPPNVHRRTRGLEETESFLRFSQRCITWGFVFMALSLVLSLGLQAYRSFGSLRAALIVAVASVLVLVVAWGIVPDTRAERARRSGAHAPAQEGPSAERDGD